MELFVKFSSNCTHLRIHLSIHFCMRLSTLNMLTMRIRCKTETFTWWSESTVFILRISLTLDKQMCPLCAFIEIYTKSQNLNANNLKTQQEQKKKVTSKIEREKKQLLKDRMKQYGLTQMLMWFNELLELVV